MHFGSVIKLLGKILLIEAICLLFPLAISLYYGESIYFVYIICILLCAFIGGLIYILPIRTRSIRIREALLSVSLGWIVMSLFGTLPFLLSKEIPSFVNALFEIVSGFTTTGSTILTRPELLSLSLSFWSSFASWIGGMGILVFTLAIIPKMDTGSFQLMRSETPGPSHEKITSRVKDAALIIFIIYASLTILETILLMIGGLSFTESISHAFSTMSSGGLSSRRNNIGDLNIYSQIIITAFMFFAGINFFAFFFLIKRDFKKVFKDEELRLYIKLILIFAFVITLDLILNDTSNLSILENIKNSIFQVISVLSTTGFTTVDYNVWPIASKVILLMLFFVGGCAGSTSGSIKISRILIVLKNIKSTFKKGIHPRAVSNIKINGKSISPNVVQSTFSFIGVYLFLFLLGTVVIAFDPNCNDILMASSSSASSLGNIGPLMSAIGPVQNYAILTDFSKIFLSFLMLVGRLEIFTVLILFSPRLWKDQ